MADPAELMEELEEEEVRDVPEEGADVLALSSRYQIDFGAPIAFLGSNYAKAYPVKLKGANTIRPLYAAIFEPSYPAPVDVIQAVKEMEESAFATVHDVGKIFIDGLKSERLVVIMDQPMGHPFHQVITEKGEGLSEQVVADRLIPQMLGAIRTLHNAGVMHGSINPFHVFYDGENSTVYVSECFTSYFGETQYPAYETINRLMCHVAGKGSMDYSADYFALGMLVLFLLTGSEPFEDVEVQRLLEFRLRYGSCDEVIRELTRKAQVTLSQRMEILLRGLLTDHDKDRWGAREVEMWLGKHDMAPPVSKMHKEASAPLHFDDDEFYGRKALAHALHERWDVARRNLRVAEISRWINLSIKQASVADRLNALVPYGQAESVIPDQLLSHIIMVLDPEGPIRFRDFSVHISGLGSYLCYHASKQDREAIQTVGRIVGDGVIQDWIDHQNNPGNYSFSVLGWNPTKIRQYVRKSALGFGMERCLYMLNPYLSCQSDLTSHVYAISLQDVLKGLETFPGDIKEIDPMDRHVAAFIGMHLGLAGEVEVKPLRPFSYLADIPQVKMLALLSIAQKETGQGKLHHLSEWIIARLNGFIEALHSRGIRRDMRSKLKQASKRGWLTDIYKVITGVQYAHQDLYGFHEARKHYAVMGMNVKRLQNQLVIQRMAYHMGLRVSVMISYIVFVVTLVYVAYQNF